MDDISVSMIAVTLWETFGWLSVIAAVVGVLLLIVLLASLARARRRRLPVGGLLLRGIVVMLVVAAILVPLVPLWTLAPVGDLRGAIDVLVAYGLALMPASVVGVLWVYVGSLRRGHASA